MSSNDCRTIDDLSARMLAKELAQMNEVDRARVDANRKIAGEFERLTDGMLSVSFAPGTWTDGDEESKNHLYFGGLNNEEEFLWLDDRRPESLPTQAAAELRRLATECNRLADQIEQHADGSQKKGGRR